MEARTYLLDRNTVLGGSGDMVVLVVDSGDGSVRRTDIGLDSQAVGVFDDLVVGDSDVVDVLAGLRQGRGGKTREG